MRTSPPTRSRRRWRGRLAVAGVLAVAALLSATLPAAANNGTIWTTLPSMPAARSDVASAAATCPPGQGGTCVYALGGLAAVGTSGHVYSYNPASNIWTALPSMPTPRAGFGAASMRCPPGIDGTCVYASGGYADTGVSATLEALDPPIPSQG
ncbi:kelch repeat-containing protein [Streptomyces sp. NBC_01294]|uniref:kelch repeat-containing protein n=1 Tax=Streptomyces sp. NBC_01294 TaxID=2903815 RepID=UPI002DDB544C|nr:kelch repeat-containing protein [Streptomyces sp. NBC_01294]WRZ55185.1 hypothetical protein OG534_00885 [Streptomyces sp. NBC_01294]WRZ61519.1 hypothetical protein OG534_36605 [Streptomyces sp. NBC_01294]